MPATDISITQIGMIVAKLTTPFQDRREIAESLFGILPMRTTYEEAIEEKLSEI